MNNLQERKVFVPVDVNEGNKLIAEFCGYKYFAEVICDDEDAMFGYTKRKVYSKVPIVLIGDDVDGFYFGEVPNPDYMSESEGIIWNTDLETLSWSTLHAREYVTDVEYHSSWDWLMPVVEKIVYEIVGKRHVLKSEEDILFFEQIGIQWRKIQLSLITPVILSEQKPIDAVYRAVIEFIKFYKGLSENKNQNQK